MKETAVAVHQDQSTDLMSMIRQVATIPNANVDALERLLAMQERVMADQRRVEFAAAQNRLATIMPEIHQGGRVVYEGKNGKEGQNRPYARLEDIDRAIRPMISAEGFSLSWDTAEGPGGKIRVIGKLSHSGGHFETKQIDLPHDTSGSKNPVQAVGSTVAYGRRMLTKMFFNIIEKNEDTDAEKAQPISDEQAKDLDAAISALPSDKKTIEAFKGKWLVFLGVGATEEIPQRLLAKATNAIDVKRRELEALKVKA